MEPLHSSLPSPLYSPLNLDSNPDFRKTPFGGQPAAYSAVGQGSRELIFVDQWIQDYENLIDQFDSQATVVLLDSKQDGIAQMSAVLAQHTGLDAVHVFSHGKAGSLQLGASTLDEVTMGGYRSALSQWSDAFAPDGDLLFYGCSLGATPDGLMLVDHLAALTGADVAASDDLTGNALLGGDWDLEVAVGAVETALAIKTTEVSGFSSVLGTLTAGTYSTDDLGPGGFAQNFVISGEVTIDLTSDLTFGSGFSFKGDNDASTEDKLTLNATSGAADDIAIAGSIGGDGLKDVTINADKSITLTGSVDVEGDIAIGVENKEVRLGISPWLGSDKDVSVTLKDAKLKAKNIKVTANAEDFNPTNDLPSWVNKLVVDPLFQTASYPLGSLVIPASVQWRGSKSGIMVDGANIEATSGKVTIASTSTVDSTVNAISTANNLNTVSKFASRAAIAFGRGLGDAQTVVKGNSSITASGDVSVTAKTTNTTKSFARVFANVNQQFEPANSNEAGASLAIANTETTAKAILESGSAINSGGNVKVDATGKVSSSAKATTAIYLSGIAGVGLSANWDTTDVEAKVDGSITAAGTADIGTTLDLSKINNNTDEITLTDHGLSTGDELVYSAGAGDAIGGLVEGETYTVFVVDQNTIRLTRDTALDIDNLGLTAGAVHSLSAQGGVFIDAQKDIDIDTDEFIVENHGFTTGQAITYFSDATGDQEGDNGKEFSDLTSQGQYYVVVTGTNRFKLAATLDRAVAGIADIDLVEIDKGTGSAHLLNYVQRSQQQKTFNGTSASVVDLANNQITINNHGFATGQVINYSTSGTSIGALGERGFYAIVIDENTLQLASTLDDALAGEARQFNTVSVLVGSGSTPSTLVKKGRTVYEYIGSDTDLYLPGVDYTDTTTWKPREDIDAATFTADPAAGTYNSSYEGNGLGTSGSHTFTYTERTNQFDPTGATLVNRDNNTIKIANHSFSTGDAVFYEVDPTITEQVDLPINLSFAPGEDVDLTADTITISTGHGLATGDSVTYQTRYLGANNTAIDGLASNSTYYAIIVNSTTLKLATSAAAAAAGTAIDLGSGASGKLHNLSTTRRVTAGDTALRGLEDSTYYHVVVIDKDIIQLVETRGDAENAAAVDLDTAAATGTSHRFQASSGLTVSANLKAKNKASSKGATGSNPTIASLLANPDLLPIAGAIFKPAKTKDLLKGGEGGFEKIQNDENKLALGAGFSLNLFKHDVKAVIGSSAVLKSRGKLSVSATTKQTLGIVADSATGKDGDGVAIATSFGIGIYDNTVQALVYDGATLDAAGELSVTSDLAYPFIFDYKKKFSFKDDPTTDKNEALEGPGNVITSLTDALLGGKLGLKSFFNNFVSTKNKGKKLTAKDQKDGKGTQGEIEGADFALAASGTYLQYDNVSEAVIGYQDPADSVIDGTLINQDLAYRSNAQSVLVDANTEMVLTSAVGIIHISLSLESGYAIAKKGNPSDALNVFGNRSKNGVGVSVLAQVMNNTTKALIDRGSAVYTAALADVEASKKDEEKKLKKKKALAVLASESLVSFELAQGGGEAKGFGFTGSGIGLGQTSDTLAQIASGTKVKGGSAIVRAESDSTRINVVGAIQKTENIGVGAGVGINLIDRNTRAVVGKEITDADSTPGIGTSILAKGDIDIEAKNTGNLVVVALSGVYNGDAPSDDAQDPNQLNISLAGNVAINQVNDSALAYINDTGKVTAVDGDLNLSANNDSYIGAFSGGAAVSVSTKANKTRKTTIGIFGSYSLSEIGNKTQAFVAGATIAAKNISLKADDQSTIIGVSVAVAGSLTTAAQNSTSVNVPGSLSQAFINTTTEAFFRDVTMDATGNVTAAASDDASIYTIGGALGFGLAASGGSGNTASITLGFSAATNDIKNAVRAYSQNSVVNGSSNNSTSGNVDFSAKTDANIFSLTIAGALSAAQSNQGSTLSIGGAAAGSGNTIESTIAAFIDGGSVAVKESGKSLSLKAENTSEIEADSGGFGLAFAVSDGAAGAASVGISASKNTLNNQTRAYIDNSAVDIAGAIAIMALADAEIRAVSIGGALSAAVSSDSAGVALAGTGAGAGNEINSTIEAAVRNQAKVTGRQGVTITAKDKSQIKADTVGAAIAAAGSLKGAGVSVAISVSIAENTVDNAVLAYIDSAEVSAPAGKLALSALSESEITGLSLAASVSVAAAGNAGGALSGGGAGAINKILGKTNAYLKDSKITDVGDVSLTANNTSKIKANIVAVSGSIGVGADAGVAAAIGAAVATNDIGDGTQSPFEVRAYLENTALEASGSLSQQATMLADIDAGVGAGSVAVAASSGTSLSAAGSGVVAVNRIATSVGATISGDGAGAIAGVRAADISLIAKDDSKIFSKAGAAAVAIAASGNVGGALSIGASIARNAISNQVEAAIISADDGVIATKGKILLDADETATITSNSVAASVAVGAGGTAGVGIAGAGAEGTNVIGNKVRAHITDSKVDTASVDYTVNETVARLAKGDRVRLGNGDVYAYTGTSVSFNAGSEVLLSTIDFRGSRSWERVNTATADSTEGDIIVDADSVTQLSAVIGGVAAAVGGGSQGGAAGALGVSVSRNIIGLESTGDYSSLSDWLDDSTDYSSQVKAYAERSELSSAGNITVEAKQTDDIKAVSFAGSVAVAAGFGAGAAAASGAETSNEFDSQVYAYMSNTTAYAANDVKVSAIADSEVTKASAIGAAVTLAVGIGGGVSIAASVVDNDITNDVRAYLTSTSAKTIDAGRDIIVTGDAKKARMDNVTAVTASISGGTVGVSGGGIDIRNTINNTVIAEVSGALTLTTDRAVKVLADEEAFIEGDAAGVTAAVAPLGVALGVALVRNEIGSDITARVDSDPAAAWTGGTPIDITADDITIAADTIANIDKTFSVGVSASSLAAAQGNESAAKITSTTAAYVEGAKLSAKDELSITGRSDNRARTSANGGALGAIAVGAMVSKIQLGKGNSVDEVTAGLGDGAVVRANILKIEAYSNDDLLAESVAAGGGAIAAAGAQSDVSNDLAAIARVGDNADIQVGTLIVSSTHEQDFDSSADSFAFAALAGSGAGVQNTISTKSNVDIGQNTQVEADNILINAINRVKKERFKDSSNLIAGSASFGNVTALASRTDIGSDVNPLEAIVNVGSGTSLTVEGSNAAPGTLEISALNDISATDVVRIEAVSGYALAVGISDIETKSDAKINLEGATLQNKSGDVYLTATTNTENRPSANLVVATAYFGTAGAEATAHTDATNNINVSNTTVKGSDIYLQAGRDSFGVPNLLESSANGELTAISLVSVSVPILKAEVRETNTIDIVGTSSLRALEDVNLVADEGIGGNDRAKVDGLVLNLSLIPYGFNISNSVGTPVSSTNRVNIGSSANVEAGINNQAMVMIKPLGSLSPARLGKTLTAAEKADPNIVGQNAQLSAGLDYEFAELSLTNIPFTVSTGTVIRDVVSGNHYRYRPITSGGDNIILQIENFSNSGTWQNLGRSLTAQQEEELTVYSSTITDSLSSPLAGKFYVIKPTEMDLPTFSYANLGNLLLEQREKVISWIANHRGNVEALARYQVQLDEIDKTLREFGLLTTETVGGEQVNVVQKELDLLFLELPNIYASPGSVFIEADGASKDTYAALVGNQIKARNGANISLINETPFALKVNDAVIKDNKRVTAVNGKYTVLAPGNVYVNNERAGANNTSDNDTKTISIVQRKTSGLDLSGLSVPTAQQDLFLLGDVINEDGAVSVSNAEGSITVSGELRGAPVTIDAQNDFTLNTDDWFHSSQDPRQYIDFNALRSQVLNNAGNIQTKEFASAAQVSDGSSTLAEAIARNSAQIVSQGDITIAARYLNVNGLIQSGVKTVSLALDASFNPGSSTKSLVDSSGKPLAGVSFGDGAAVDAYFDASKNAVVVDDIVAGGGNITLVGRLLSTGNGRLQSASGYANVDIDNNSQYDLILNKIDNTTDRNGKIKIIDTDLKEQVVYTTNSTGVTREVFNGALTSDGSRIEYTSAETNKLTGPVSYQVGFDITDSQKKENRYYVWTEGQEKTEVEVRKFEKKSFNLFGDNSLADKLAKDNSYVWRTITFRDEQPLLESESLTPNGTTATPAYAVGDDYTVRYELRNDRSIDLIKDTSLVKYVGPGSNKDKVFLYRGDSADINISALGNGDFDNSDLWAESAVTFSESDPAQNRFLNTYQNASVDVDTWTTGGGWLRKKTVHTKTTTVTGRKDFYTHTLRADRPIAVNFLQGSAAPRIDINVQQNLFLQGDIDSPVSDPDGSRTPLGTIELTSSQGSILADDTVGIYGANPLLSAGTGQEDAIKVTLEGDKGALTATAGGNISVTAVSLDNASSRLTIDKVESTGGNVSLNAANGIETKGSAGVVRGDRIALSASSGAIGSSGTLRIDSDTASGGGLTAKASGNLNVTEIAGALKLLEVADTTDATDAASVESVGGDVRLTTVNGAILDRTEELFDAQQAAGPELTAQLRTQGLEAIADEEGVLTLLYQDYWLNYRGATKGEAGSATNNTFAAALADGSVPDAARDRLIAIDQTYGNGSYDPDFVFQYTAAERETLLKKRTFDGRANSPISPSLYSKLFPNANFLGTSPAQTSPEITNVKGGNVILEANGSDGRIGDISGVFSIDLSSGFDGVTDESEKAAMTNAIADDVIGLSYALYFYRGGAGEVDLAQTNFDNTGLWEKLTIAHTTQTDRLSPQTVTLAAGEYVLVQYSESEYGIYEYLGAGGSVELARQDFAQTSLWKGVTTNLGTDTNAPVAFTDGRQNSQRLVANKNVIERLTLQLKDDVNVAASVQLTADANKAAALESNQTLRLNHVNAGGNVRIKSGGSILDAQTDGTAGVTSLGSLVLEAGGSVGAANGTDPLRVRVASTGQLSGSAAGHFNVQQVTGGSVTIGDITAEIGDLTLPSVNATNGAVTVEVTTGTLRLGKVATGDSADLRAKDDIVDLFNDVNATVVNVETGNVIAPATGNVYLQAGGNIGTADNNIDVSLAEGNLNAQAGKDVFVHSVDSLNVGSVESTGGNVNLDVEGDANLSSVSATSGTVTIDAEGSILDGDNNTISNINAVNVELRATGSTIGSDSNALDIDSSNASGGWVKAQAEQTIYLTETAGDMRVARVESTTADVNLETAAGSIVDANSDEATNVRGTTVTLIATQGSVGDISDDLEVDTAVPTAGRLNITADQNIYITEASGGLAIGAITTQTGDARLTVRETAASGEDLLLDSAASVTAQAGSVTLRAGDNLTIRADGRIEAQQTITLLGDYLNPDDAAAVPDPGTGTAIDIDGQLRATDILIAGAEGDDLVDLHVQALIGDTRVEGRGGSDEIRVDRLPSLDETKRGARDRDTLTLDGQADSDRYIVNITGETTDYVINVFDSGPDAATDELTVNGLDQASNADEFLLRASEQDFNAADYRDGGVAFVAALHGETGGDPDTRTERINYNKSLDRLVLDTRKGDDKVTLDDNWTVTQIMGGEGKDQFQVGQIFKSERDALAGLAETDIFSTVETTRGFLSNGVSFETTIDGNQGDDEFTVYRNVATLNLNGNESDDTFTIRSFALEGSTDSNISAGAGADTIEYTVNSPVNVNGGAGDDLVRIIGTELDDTFVLKANSVFSAGRQVAITDMEKLEILGAEGNDTFHIHATDANTQVSVYGGLGSDTFDIGSDIPTVQAAAELAAQEGPHNLSGIQGELLIDGFYPAEGFDTASIEEPVLLPSERNELATTGEVISYTGTGTGSAIDAMVVETADLLSATGAASANELASLLAATSIEISQGKGLRRFWQIQSVATDAATGFTTLTLKNPSQPSPDWELPDGTSQYALGSLAGSFFVDEKQSFDRVSFFNDGSTTDETGTLTANTLSGLGMDANITYGSNFEAAEVLLGSGNDQFTVENTADGAVTAVHGGGGSDRITATGRGGADSRGREAALVIFGDTSEDGSRYTDTTTAVNPDFAYSFSNAGNDQLDASALNKTVALYGGEGDDTIIGSQAGDQLAGGAGNDRIQGEAGIDHIYGDSGFNVDLRARSLTVPTTDEAGSDTIDGGAGDDVIFGDHGIIDQAAGTQRLTTPASAERISSSEVTNGAADTIEGGAGNDIVIAGAGNDTVSGGAGNDLLFGDHGQVQSQMDAVLSSMEAEMRFTFTSTATQSTDGGGDDDISGGAGADILIGGQGGDILRGNAGADDLIGGHNVADGQDGADKIDGGAGNDAIAGDNASILRKTDSSVNNRFQALQGSALSSGVTGAAQADPSGTTAREITLFNHSDTPLSGTAADDAIAGGAGNDEIFGQLGNDTIQGDGSIDLEIAATGESVEDFAGQGTDGDDYIEGNGGDDLIFGNLGQDDIIGGSSSLRSLTASSDRPDGADTIYGGAGSRLARFNRGDDSSQGNARDADVILADNGNIYRIVGTNGSATDQFATFNYDNYDDDLKIVPRAIELLDYTEGGAASDVGAADRVHGESGDDIIHGQTGNDVLFGESHNDDITGGTGSDRIYGGSGIDGIIGDDGSILTSRNGLPEALSGLNTANAQQSLEVLKPFVGTVEHIVGLLHKEARLAAPTVGIADVIYGGTGDDFIHAGAGDDAVSGAEALAEFYNDDPVTHLNPLGYDPVTGKLAAYDANNPRTKIDGFLLNFEATDASGRKIEDGKDRLFGGNGNDWLVGGTGNDRLFGGLGDDLLNADDNHDTGGGTNDVPDAVEFADADFAFGGNGRDVLIANTGADRLFDWKGEFNSYVVPFTSFGNPTVNRQFNKPTTTFLRTLGRLSGADSTLSEPNGELGLGDGNTGRPRDPQPGSGSASVDFRGEPEDDTNKTLTADGSTPGSGSRNSGNGGSGNGDSGDGTLTYSADTAVNIINRGSVNSTITISDSYRIEDLDVQLDIIHTRVSDLKVFLYAPDGTKVELFSAVGGKGDNFTGTVFDDDAKTSVTIAAAPFIGTFRPEGDLSLFEGKNISGEWRLEVQDTQNNQAGTLNSWSLIVKNDHTGGSTGGGTGNEPTTYSTNTAVNIINRGSVNSTITISDSYSIKDLNVQLDISHTRVSDLRVFLYAPEETKVELFSAVGGKGDSFTDTVFDDEATTSVTVGAAPFIGTFRPEGDLSLFEGLDVAGEWRLEVQDTQNRQAGTLNSWSLIIEA